MAERVLVDDASFSVHPGDKVGLVGRNGAGKTTLLRIARRASAAPTPASSRTGAIGFLPQEPRTDAPSRQGRRDGIRAVGSRARRRSATSSSELRRDMEDDPDDHAIRRFSNAEQSFRDAGGYRAESEVHRILAGLGLPADRAPPAARRALGW